MSTVTFGKYRGQPLSVLIKDKQYLQWCQQQDWFQKKYPDLCSIEVEQSDEQTIHNLEEENIRLSKQIEKNKNIIENLKKNKFKISLKPRSKQSITHKNDDTYEDDPQIIHKKCLL